MTDHRGPKDRNSAPDTIPEDIVGRYEAEARATIAAAKMATAKRGRLTQIRHRVLNDNAGKTLVALATIALVSLIVWLSVAPESVALFVLASTLMLCAALAVGRWIWRVIAA